MGEREDRRNYIKAVGALVAGLAVGAAITWIGVEKKTEVQGPAVTQTATVTQTVTATPTPTPTPTPAFPRTAEAIDALLTENRDKLFDKLMTAARASSVDWRQCEGEQLNFTIRTAVDNEPYAQMCEMFRELAGVTIEMDITPEVPQREKATLDIMERTGIYELSFVDNMHLPMYVAADAVDPYEPLFEDPTLTDKDFFAPDDWYEPIWLAANAPPHGESGMHYCIPNVYHHCLLYYRKDLFEELGYTTKDIDTFDALDKTCHEIHNPPNYYGWVSRGQRGEGMNIFTWQVFHRGLGGAWFDEDWNTLINEPESVAAMEEYVKLMTECGPPGVEAYDFTATLTTAGEGKTAIGLDCDCWATLLWDPRNAIDEVLGNVYAARVPEGPAGRHAGFFFWSFCLPKGIKTEKKKKAAWLFCEFAHSPLGVALLNSLSLAILPSRPSVWDIPEIKAITPPNDWIEVKDLSQRFDAYFDDRPMIPEWPEVGDIAGVALSSALAGERTSKEACDWAAGEIEEVMRRAGYYG